jgi:hypothetical protein
MFINNHHLVNNDLSSIDLLILLADRLEHLSVDSRWARLASGLRGNIIKLIEQANSGDSVSPLRLKLLVDKAFEILHQAAKDIPDFEALIKKTMGP